MEQIREISAEERLDWLRLIRSENVGPITFFQLLDRFGTAKKALDALPELARKGGRKRPIRIFPVAAAKKEMSDVKAFGGHLIAACEPDYPARLRHIPDPPPVISLMGHAALLNKDIVAIVGARNSSAVAQKMARAIAAELSGAGLVIASGLARGIDAAAHQAALQGGTIGVVGGGVDYPYPRENAALQRELYERGAVIAEQPLGTVPQARHFPRRNRIISGLSLGVLVVEASPKSGSLITARLALEQGREVFAMPGSPMDPRARGTNNLIRNGATLTESAEDILNAVAALRDRPLREPDQPLLPFTEPAQPEEAELEEIRPRLLSLLSPTPVEIDEILRLLDCPPPAVLTILLELELAGRIERHFGNRVSIVE
ncbi:MAG: DNA-protecting protein DprA [Alphaproteobacteria bacterium]|nr:MAG: DNA-protecting protein DprA [Alphaproteobacteria bacterium]